MKKIWIVILTLLSVNLSYGQTKLGLKLSPSFINNRVLSSVVPKNANSPGLRLRTSIALTIDMPLSGVSGDYYMNTGIGYISKLVKMDVDGQNGDPDIVKKYNIQYLQIPFTLKLYTSELAVDKRFYFQLGPMFDIKIHDKEDNPQVEVIQKFRPIDISLVFAIGIDYRIGTETTVYGGIRYSRGFVNLAKQNAPEFGDLILKNDAFGIDIGIRF